MRQLLGTIAEKDGMICLQTSPCSWFPLGGNSSIAEEFRETFNEPGRHDIGKRLYRVGGVIQMENDAQLAERLAPLWYVSFSAARGVVAPNYYNTDVFHGSLNIKAENEREARDKAIAEVYRKHDAENVGHVVLKTVERVDA